MTVHILSPDDHVFSLNRVTARIGFLALGEEVNMFEEDDFDDLPLKADDIVVGGIGFARRAMHRLGLEAPVLDSVPDSLLPYAGRRIWPSTMGDLRERVNAGEVIFAKPRPDRLKAFNGQLFSAFKDLIPTSPIDDDEPIECSEPVEFVSEYRCFLLRGDPVGVRHYKGDPLVFPDADVIADAVGSYVDVPMGCGLDFGVTVEGKTVVVEVNDGYAIGAYGLAPIYYANVIAARWTEIRAG